MRTKGRRSRSSTKKARSGADVVTKMKELPMEDALFAKGSIRKNGRTVHDMYLFEETKPSESQATLRLLLSTLFLETRHFGRWSKARACSPTDHLLGASKCVSRSAGSRP
jgi:hypothetical protein